ncbi:MAG: TonB-dependent receptor [Cytophagales bacterium]
MLHLILLSMSMLMVVNPSDSIPFLQDSLKEDVIVNAVRADDLLPVSQYNYSKAEIKEKYYGQDISYLIQNSPSIQSQSDAGNGFGYTYFRIRGLDFTRINFNINGIPVNDPESQGFFSNNFADLASSAQSIQIQRGVGATSYGTAPYVGSLGIVTNDLKAPTSFGLSTGYGSYNSSRVTAEYNSGLLNNKFAFYGRLSSLKSDGYRNHSGSNLKTYFISGGYFGKKSILKFNAFGGITRSQLAYNPVDKTILEADRKANPQSGNETDEFQQNFYQLQYSYKINFNLSLSASAYYVTGDAPRFAINIPGFPFFAANMPDIIVPFTNDSTGTAILKNDTIRSTTMLASYRLKSQFYGAFAFLNYNNSKLNVTAGVHANSFAQRHFMEVLAADVFPLGYTQGQIGYSNIGYKQELSAFAKVNYYIKDYLIAFADLQIRNARFQYQGENKLYYPDNFKVENMNWFFFNPKAGFRFIANKNVSVFASIGRTSREPTRTDYLIDDRAIQDVKQSDIKPETVTDFELGVDYCSKNVQLNANIFLMEFENDIAATGELNAVGYLKRKNVGNSYRRGLEIAANVKVMPWLSFFANSSFSENRIKAFAQTYSVLDTSFSINYTNVNPVLTPAIISNQGVRISPFDWLYAEISSRYVAKSYLDNTNNEALTTPEYVVFDFSAGVKLGKWLNIKEANFIFHANNFTDTEYYTGGKPSHYFEKDASGLREVTSPSYFAAVTRNFFATLQLKF